MSTSEASSHSTRDGTPRTEKPDKFSTRTEDVPLEVVDEYDNAGIRSLQSIKKRLLAAPPTAIWSDFPDIRTLARLRPARREVRRIVDLLRSVDTNCADSECMFVDKRLKPRMAGRIVHVSKAIHMLCSRTFNVEDRVGSLCPCPSTRFVNGQAVVQSVSSTTEQPANHDLCCVNPHHLTVRAESAARKREREEADTYQVSHEVLAEHWCPLLGGGDRGFRPQICKRFKVPCMRPDDVYKPIRPPIYQSEFKNRYADNYIDN
jgi:hypothetical protein